MKKDPPCALPEAAAAGGPARLPVNRPYGGEREGGLLFAERKTFQLSKVPEEVSREMTTILPSSPPTSFQFLILPA